MKKFACIALAAVFLAFSAMGTTPAIAEGDPDFDPPLAPLGLPPIPKDNPSGKNIFPSKLGPKQELGYLLIFDPKLSGDASLACTTCHDPKQGWNFSDPISRGYPGTVHWRNSQSLTNSGHWNKLFWTGSVTSLEAQAPSAAKGLSGNGEADMMESRLAMTPDYRKRFREVFGTRMPIIKDAWAAISAYERYLTQIDTPFDNFMNGDKKAISDQAKSGKKIFEGKGNCIECHNGPMTSDEKYYNLGVPQPPEWTSNGLNQATFRFENYAKGVTEDIYRHNKYDLGLYYREKRDADKGKFRTPMLRYLKYNAPYMHNGAFFTLEEVVDFYNNGGGEDPLGTKTKIMKKLKLSDGEKADIIAFIDTFSGRDIGMPIPKLPSIERFSNWKPKKHTKPSKGFK